MRRLGVPDVHSVVYRHGTMSFRWVACEGLLLLADVPAQNTVLYRKIGSTDAYCDELGGFPAKPLRFRPIVVVERRRVTLFRLITELKRGTAADMRAYLRLAGEAVP